MSSEQKDSLRQQAAKLAIEDAKEKAKFISKTAGLELLKIKWIEYDSDNYASRNKDNDIVMEKTHVGEMKMRIRGGGSSSPTIDFNPSDIGIQKTVEVVWLIKEK